MVNVQRFSKGLFKKQHALSPVVVFGEDTDIEADASHCASIIESFAAEHGERFNYILFMFTASPSYINDLFGSVLGWAMVIGSAVMAGAGFAWIQKIIKIEV